MCHSGNGYKYYQKQRIAVSHELDDFVPSQKVYKAGSRSCIGNGRLCVTPEEQAPPKTEDSRESWISKSIYNLQVIGILLISHTNLFNQYQLL